MLRKDNASFTSFGPVWFCSALLFHFTMFWSGWLWKGKHLKFQLLKLKYWHNQIKVINVYFKKSMMGYILYTHFISVISEQKLVFTYSCCQL